MEVSEDNKKSEETKEIKSESDGSSSNAIQIASAAALAGAVLKAKVLVEREDKEIQRLITTIVETQLKKLEIKLKLFEDLEEVVEREKVQVERARQQLANERATLLNKSVLATPISTSDPTSPGALNVTKTAPKQFI